MKKMLLLISLIAAPLSLPADKIPTYDELRQQIEDEANTRVKDINITFMKSYFSSIQRLGISAILTGIFLPLTVQAIKKNQALWACLFSSLMTACGVWAVVEYSDVNENRRFCHDQILKADDVYNEKLAYIHTRHYMNDIAKFLASKLEVISQKMSAPVNEASPTENV